MPTEGNHSISIRNTLLATAQNFAFKSAHHLPASVAILGFSEARKSHFFTTCDAT
jgi:hypothetical protein